MEIDDLIVQLDPEYVIDGTEGASQSSVASDEFVSVSSEDDPHVMPEVVYDVSDAPELSVAMVPSMAIEHTALRVSNDPHVREPNEDSVQVFDEPAPYPSKRRSQPEKSIPEYWFSKY